LNLGQRQQVGHGSTPFLGQEKALWLLRVPMAAAVDPTQRKALKVLIEDVSGLDHVTDHLSFETSCRSDAASARVARAKLDNLAR